jgi:hypothetical protein
MADLKDSHSQRRKSSTTSPKQKFIFLVSPSKKNRMWFIQFILLNDLTKVTQIGLQKTNVKTVDLSKDVLICKKKLE